ncbi:maleylpyruvate isomerase N-terminal domain-containing protein [Adhaeribacter aquaticus]|uniref:maleylpyruvate isomerase N-terminal domain-containing protein n=1 Tax=Adhaeribacter aquaticus TaxID=299567 RepID=UPI00041D25EE|nr:maleylpyruvate isomerase N-terminal domain-containing protein [Adhaeribacter aquaticus]
MVPEVASLFPKLEDKLIDLLQSLTPEEWEAQTVAKLWKVKDVVAHLLDGNIRTLSIQRDKYFGETPPAINSYQDLVNWLNGLNADWVKASKRISPAVLVLLHQATGKLVCDYYASLDPMEPAIFPVAWAGEEESKNWLHVAREYTEKWLHQQQIRDAVNKPGLMTREFFYPFIGTFMLALPHTYRNISAKPRTCIKLTVETEIGGTWFLVKDTEAWNLTEGTSTPVTTEINLNPDTAWKLFSKSWRPENVMDKVKITGDQQLGEVALSMVSVMA